MSEEQQEEHREATFFNADDRSLGLGSEYNNTASQQAYYTETNPTYLPRTAPNKDRKRNAKQASEDADDDRDLEAPSFKRQRKD